MAQGLTELIVAPSGFIPFCPEVKGMQSFGWLKIKEGKTSGNPKINSKPFLFFFHKKKHDICMLLGARMILEWAFYSVNLTATKRPK